MRCSLLKVCSCAIALFLGEQFTLADIIYLQNGQKIEGAIVKDGGTSYDVEVKVSNGITDVRTIQKTDFLRVEKPDPATLEFDAVKATQLPKNSLTVSEYDQIISGRLKPFLVKYPLSENASAVKKIVAAFTVERDRVKAGEVKVNGQWFNAADAEKNKYQIEASRQFQQIQATAAKGDILGALNQFTVFEKAYGGARVYPDAVVYVRSILPVVRGEIESKSRILQNDLEERKKGLEITPEYRKPQLIAAAAQEEAQVNAALDEAEKAGTLWTPIYPMSQRSIDDLQKTLTAESTRLATLKTSDMSASIAASDDGRELLKKGDPDSIKAADAKFQDAAKLWAGNDMAKENVTLLAAAKATPAPTPVASATPVKTPVAAHTPRATPAGAPATAPAVVAEPEKSFFATLPGMLSILVIVAIIGGGISFAVRSGKRNGASA